MFILKLQIWIKFIILSFQRNALNCMRTDQSPIRSGYNWKITVSHDKSYKIQGFCKTFMQTKISLIDAIDKPFWENFKKNLDIYLCQCYSS